MGINRQAIMCMTLKKKKKRSVIKTMIIMKPIFVSLVPPWLFFFNTKLAIKARSL